MLIDVIYYNQDKGKEWLRMKVDRRKTYYLMIDTETCNNMDNPFVYDIGLAIVDKYGNAYEKHSFVIRDIFMHERELMQSAYYAEKIPNYWNDIWNGKRKVISYYDARAKVHELCNQYNVRAIIAHNMPFDYRATATTQRWLTKSRYRHFFPKDIELWDTLRMARQVVVPMPTYRVWAENRGYVDKYGKPRATAEILYKFITCNDDFIESHTGLEDVEIESQIFAYCMAKHKKMKREAFSR